MKGHGRAPRPDACSWAARGVEAGSPAALPRAQHARVVLRTGEQWFGSDYERDSGVVRLRPWGASRELAFPVSAVRTVMVASEPWARVQAISKEQRARLRAQAAAHA